MPNVVLDNSSFLDLTSFASNSTHLPSGSPASGEHINLALVLERANPVADLLQADWATRQKTIAELTDNNTIWSTYGADAADFAAVIAHLEANAFKILGGDQPGDQYVTSQESRTIWVQVDETQFHDLFDQTLMKTPGGELFWEHGLSLPEELVEAGVVGIWFDTGRLGHARLADPAPPTTPAALPDGPQSQGNSSTDPVSLFPNEIAADHYNFPLASRELWGKVDTGRIGLIEPGIGDALKGDTASTFDELLLDYREKAGVTVPLKPTIVLDPGGENFDTRDERSLDVGIATSVNPTSQLVLYAGSGYDDFADAERFTAYQQAIWDTANNPVVVSSSFSSFNSMHPDSPFYAALEMLFEDAVLRNITMVNAAGDGGSGAKYANGFTNTEGMHSSAYSLIVSGTSLSTVASADADATLATIVEKAMGSQRAAIWKLVSGGLTELPKAGSGKSLIEAVWNEYNVFDGAGLNDEDVIAGRHGTGGGYLVNQTAAGGVDITQPVPSYQRDFGLDPVSQDPRALPGRGIPDVAANAGGNLSYTVPTSDLESTEGNGGTSASSPLWAALIAQIDAIFEDQNLPQLGFMNELLYTAAVIAPGAFNDITVGNNVSSFVLGGAYLSGGPTGTSITPTGYGSEAEAGYDLVTGLGTPNGVLLARAMTWVAHSQMATDETPPVLARERGWWRGEEKQSLLFQVTAPEASDVSIRTGGRIYELESDASRNYAWTSRFAEQALQRDFDARLVRLFDHQSQAALIEKTVKADGRIGVEVDGVFGSTPQASLSADFGFVDFVSGNEGAVRVARPVAVAETVGGADDQVAVVRMRQGGEGGRGDYVVQFFRVDDYAGTIDGLKPGSADYKAAARERTYETVTGQTHIKGPGYGQYREAFLTGIDDGDIVAMKLIHDGRTYWAFARGNELLHGEHVGHLWNYGLNTWGWEGEFKGGDRDFNDLVVQIDFTSASGSGWLSGGNIFGTSASDVLDDGTAEDDRMFGLRGDDTLATGLGDDVLSGGRGDDRLFAGDGADRLIGGFGKDRLDGGDEADVFKFSSVLESRRGDSDVILNFESGIDTIDLSAIDAKTGVPGNNVFSWIGRHDFHHRKGELRAEDLGSRMVLKGDTDGDGRADFAVVVEGGGLTDSDIVL